MSAQDWIVAAIVLAAAVFVGRRLWRSWKGEADGSCDKCSK